MEILFVLYNYLCIPVVLLFCLLLFLWFLHKKNKTLKQIEAVGNAIWDTSHEFLFLIDSSSHVVKTNFYSIFNLNKPSRRQCFGDVMCCKYAAMMNACNKHDFCSLCPIRHKIRETLKTHKPFDNLEIVMDFGLPEKERGLYNMTVSGRYLLLGKKEYVFLSVNDVSKEHELETSVKKNSEKFSSVFENLPVGCAICDKNGTIIEVNSGYVDYLGLESKADSVGKLNIFDNPCINPEFKEMMHKGIPVSGEVKYDYELLNRTYVRSSHRECFYYRFIVNYIKNPKDEIDYYVIIWVDNTLIHKTLRQNQAYYDMIAFASSVSNIGFASFSMMKVENTTTPEYLYNLGMQEQDGAVSIFELLGNLLPEDRQEITDYLVKASKEKTEPYEKDIRVWINGEQRWIKQFMMQQVFEPEKENVVLLSVNIDINSQKQIEQELKTAKEKAENSDRLKSVFLSHMSHEVRTPLNSIVGFSNLLVGEDDKEQRKRFASIVEANSLALSNLMSDIFQLSQFESGAYELNWSNCDLETVCGDIMQNMRLKNKNQEVQLHFYPEPKGLYFKSDVKLLSLILVNLLDNAIKYTTKGHIDLSYKLDGNSVYFTVKDTGCGIEKEELPLIFQLFVKINTGERQGTGLGLSICQDVVKMLGGEMGVSSEVGVGSTFWFRLPCNN